MVIDNFLDPDDFSAVKQIFTNTSFPWYMNPGISDRFSTGSITNPLDNYYFTHLLYMNHQITSEHFESLSKIYFEQDPIQADQFEKIWTYEDWAKENPKYSATDKSKFSFCNNE